VEELHRAGRGLQRVRGDGATAGDVHPTAPPSIRPYASAATACAPPTRITRSASPTSTPAAATAGFVSSVRGGVPIHTSRTASDVHPPLYYLALKAWTLAWGDSETRKAMLNLLIVVGPIFGMHYREPRPEPPTIATPGDSGEEAADVMMPPRKPSQGGDPKL